jgi:hypothetical protein
MTNKRQSCVRALIRTVVRAEKGGPTGSANASSSASAHAFAFASAGPADDFVARVFAEIEAGARPFAPA